MQRFSQVALWFHVLPVEKHSKGASLKRTAVTASSERVEVILKKISADERGLAVKFTLSGFFSGVCIQTHSDTRWASR